MSSVTVIWSMFASACFTLAVIYFLVWWRNRTAWANLLFAMTAASTAAFTLCELRQMRTGTPAELLSAMRWTHVALLGVLVSTAWFVTLYLGAGRRWLAWTVSGLRTFYLLVAFLVWGNVNYLEITSLRQVPFLGDSVTVFQGIPNPWMLFGYATMLLILIFVADASVTAWRRGERRKALMVGGSVELFLLLGTVAGRAGPLGAVAHPRPRRPALRRPGRRNGLRVESRGAPGIATRARASGKRGRVA